MNDSGFRYCPEGLNAPQAQLSSNRSSGHRPPPCNAAIITPSINGSCQRVSLATLLTSSRSDQNTPVTQNISRAGDPRRCRVRDGWSACAPERRSRHRHGRVLRTGPAQREIGCSFGDRRKSILQRLGITEQMQSELRRMPAETPPPLSSSPAPNWLVQCLSVRSALSSPRVSLSTR